MKTKILLLALFVVLAAPAWVMAGQVEGTIQGFSCVVQGKACPIDREDPLVTFEKNFVLLTFDGDYFLIPNLDRAILARHLRERVRISGTINKTGLIIFFPQMWQREFCVLLQALKPRVWSIFPLVLPEASRAF